MKQKMECQQQVHLILYSSWMAFCTGNAYKRDYDSSKAQEGGVEVMNMQKMEKNLKKSIKPFINTMEAIKMVERRKNVLSTTK